MDKRFFTALLLVALVVAITPILFPTPRRPVPVAGADSVTPRDSGARAASGLPDANGVADQPAGQPAIGTGTGTPAASVRPETTTVTAGSATYRFSNVGARPVSVVLDDYYALSRGGRLPQHVELVRPNEWLLRYHLVTRGDTVSLDAVPFIATRMGNELRFTGSAAGMPVTIAYQFTGEDHLLRVSGTIQGAPPGSYVAIDLPSGLRSQEADTVDDAQHLAYAVKPKNTNATGIPFSKLSTGESRLEKDSLTWVVAKSKYFLVGLLRPEGGQPFVELTAIGGPRAPGSKLATRASATTVMPLRDGAFGFELYAGPMKWRKLHALGRDFENANPYGGILQGVVQPFATIVMRLLLWMKENLGFGYGWILVLFGITVRLIMWPLNQSAMRTSLKMQRIQPQVQAIQERYKSDPEKLRDEMMKVYKEHGMSPFSTFSGCLPMLLPMPILFALYYVFNNTIEFRGVSFLWLPDISLRDPFFITPILMGLSMFLMSWVGMRNSPPNPQAKMMMFMMPVMLTVLFFNFASGLNLYYAVQNIAAIPQQWLLARERGKEPTVTGIVRGTPMPAQKGRT
jgi:YidC/Oxa1 family membrane protein insertase